jgi:hypothetical protein
MSETARTGHNHLTRAIQRPGKCPGCDAPRLPQAIREAKIASGLDPDKTYPPTEFYDQLGEWSKPFWEWQVSRVIAADDPTRGV